MTEESEDLLANPVQKGGKYDETSIQTLDHSSDIHPRSLADVRQMVKGLN